MQLLGTRLHYTVPGAGLQFQSPGPDLRIGVRLRVSVRVRANTSLGLGLNLELGFVLGLRSVLANLGGD